ncbi:uncharacterized protein GIQ15_06616 [Arthroderma uncinatum]|uniref:uncharacterized protein n=1 Tax=Arthroderma uncinatum TaxID=74035 RepID=UPI00144A4CFD|nr:uncharacterized protein GIQ15_06616 [Arthroderma uncinatum]KAF3479640.1 hypothetical protein GIQ15_06616 [Arthroderma uncinatum]
MPKEDGHVSVEERSQRSALAVLALHRTWNFDETGEDGDHLATYNFWYHTRVARIFDQQVNHVAVPVSGDEIISTNAAYSTHLISLSSRLISCKTALCTFQATASQTERVKLSTERSYRREHD